MRKNPATFLWAVVALSAAWPSAASASLPYPPDTLWAMTYDAGDLEKAYRARITGDGGYIICGSTRSPGAGDTDAYLVRTTPRGTPVWAEHYGGPNTEELYDVQQTADGGFVAVGYTSTNTAGYFDVYLVRLDAAGDTIWTHTYGGIDYDYGYSVAQAPDGGFFIAGRTSSFGRGWRSAYIIRTDADGDTLWTRAHGGWGKDEAYAVVTMPDGGCMAAGYTESYGAGAGDMWLLRIDADGDTLWTRTYGGAMDERAEDLRRTADKGFVLAGSTDSFGAGQYDMYIVKVDAAGNVQWSRTYGGTSMEHAYSVSQTLDMGFVAAGYTDSYGSGGRDVYVIRCDEAGDTLWTKTLGGTSTDYGYAAQQTAGGGYMVCGWTSSMGAGDGDAFLAMLAPSDGCPIIQAVSDVPFDDGGLVEISWLASFYDNAALDGHVKRYKIWREVRQPDISFTTLDSDGGDAVSRPSDRRELTEQGGLWQLVGQAPAASGSLYTFVASTNCGLLDPGRCRGCFYISAHTGELGRYFTSPPMCGYAIDDLGAPEGTEEAPAAGAPRRLELRVAEEANGTPGRRVEFVIPDGGRVSIDVFTVTGRKALTLYDGILDAGEHSISVDAPLARLAPGTYFLSLMTASGSKSAKMVVLR